MGNSEESSPLLSNNLDGNDEKKATKPITLTNPPLPAEVEVKQHHFAGVRAAPYTWAAGGLPMNNGGVIGERMARSHWDSSLCACLGRNDEFCSSDLEVCILGSVTPCVLYGSNAERLGTAPGTFANHCLPYSGLYFLGNSLLGWNVLAPCFASSTRTAIRRKFNLEGSCEAFTRSCGCCGSMIADDLEHENCESACDLATHIFCHPCALCQEGRELRRKVLHPGFNAQPVLVMVPPTEQSMGRNGA